MAPQFRWPFSMKYLYTMDEFRPFSPPPSPSPIAALKQFNQRSTFRWPFSLKYLYTMDEFRLLASSPSPSPSPSPIAADVVPLPETTSTISVSAEDLTPSAEISELDISGLVESDEDSEVIIFPMPNVSLEPKANIKPLYSSDDNYHPKLPNSLRKRIFEAFVKSAFDGSYSRKFIPRNSLIRLVTEGSVVVELRFNKARHQPEDAELVTYICSNAVKIFATAVYMKCTGERLRKMMRRLHKHTITDEDLPMQLEDSESKWKSLRWSKYTKEDFYDAQWAFLAPVFSVSQVQYELAPDCVLPFVEIAANDARQHSIDLITKVRIHEDHFVQAQQTANKYVAVKQINASVSSPDEVDQSWRMEYEALYEVTALKHPHILRLIAAVKRGHNRYFIFPWADGGSLRDFWRQHKRLTLNKDVVSESVYQLRGLADALDRVHNLGNHGDISLRHGDLKPENILVFPDNSSIGNLKIGDWGLAKKHVVRTEERRYRTSTRYGTMLYEAPEAVGEDSGRSRLYDIWALGCVALEHLVWLLYGEKEQQRFLEDLMKDDRFQIGFYRRTGKKVTVHPEVIRWMEHISVQFPAGTSVGDLVEVIRTKLLVFDLPPVYVFAEPLGHSTDTSDSSAERPSASARLFDASMDGTSSMPALSVEAKQPEHSERNGPYRARAKDIVSCFDLILHGLEEDNQYCFSNRPYNELKGPQEYSATYVPPSSEKRKAPDTDSPAQAVWQPGETSSYLPEIQSNAIPMPIQEHNAVESSKPTQVTGVSEASNTPFQPLVSENTRFVSSPIGVPSNFRAHTEKLYRRSDLRTLTEKLGSSHRLRGS